MRPRTSGVISKNQLMAPVPTKTSNFYLKEKEKKLWKSVLDFVCGGFFPSLSFGIHEINRNFPYTLSLGFRVKVLPELAGFPPAL